MGGGNTNSPLSSRRYVHKDVEDSTAFFAKLDHIFEMASEKIRPSTKKTDCDEYALLLRVIPFLKELTEGHRKELQVCIAEQKVGGSATEGSGGGGGDAMARTSFNILKRACNFILAITADEIEFSKRCDTDMVILVTEILNFLIEATQGRKWGGASEASTKE